MNCKWGKAGIVAICVGLAACGNDLAFEYEPGPPFQAGDFTMSTVAYQGDLVTVAGEFGVILQTEDERISFVHRTEMRLWGDGWLSLGEPGDAAVAIRFRHL